MREKCTIGTSIDRKFMLLVGSCSATKRFPVSPALDASGISARTLGQYAAKWLRRVEEAQPVAPATQVYGGAGHAALTQAAQGARAGLVFVSAGLGVVQASEEIPAYNLTVARSGPGPFAAVDASFEPHAWWQAVHANDPSPLASCVRRHEGVVVLALPAIYLAMVAQDLATLTPAERRRLRIITTAGVRLASGLQAQAVCYDDRLGLHAGYSGAMASLVQRAAQHFVTEVLGDRRIHTIEGEIRRIEQVLASRPTRARPQRKQASDKDIRGLIRPMARKGMSITRALDSLRGEHGVACEQGRFKTIYEEVASGCA